ncbi:MAG: DUF3341 domain-containing protein [Myxococcales bacterium]|nr:MAG: DUF3341 domain-containing protein [Myxococcales bacterium]
MTQGNTKAPALVLAEFETPKALIHATEALRDAGYKNFDAHTPYPVHGMDKAMGLRDTPLGWLSLGGGITGLLSAFAMMYWMNGVDYPLVIGGKPPAAIPSMIPVMFELTILLTGFGTFFGLLHLMKLPRHHHPVFYSDRFERFSDDRFYLSVAAEDPKFDASKTQEFLQTLAPSYLELVHEEES